MKKKNSLQFKIYLFAFITVALIVTIGGFFSILLFKNSASNEYANNIQNAATSFDYLVVNNSVKQLNDYLDSLKCNGVTTPEDFLSPKILELPANIAFLSFQMKGANPIILGIPPSNMKFIEGSKSWIEVDNHTGLYVVLSKQTPGSPFVLTTGTRVSSNEYVQQIKKTFDFDATIFSGNKRISTTIFRDGHYQVGTKLNQKISSIVLGKGQDYAGTANILGVSYLTYYRPLTGYDGKPVGVLFVGTPSNRLQYITWKVAFAVMGVGLLLILAFSLITFHWLNRRLLAPLAGLTQTIKHGSIGNLDMKNVNNYYTELKDLYQSLNDMSGEILQNRFKIESLAYYNQITNLANREKLIAKYAGAKPVKDKIHCLYYLDIDHFKLVNDLLGHKVGDLLIAEVGKLLSDFVNVHVGHELYHTSGGSFILCRLIPFEKNELHQFSIELLDLFRRAELNQEHKLSTTISIGISYCNNTYDAFCNSCSGGCRMNLYELLKNSEIALYRAKSNGRNGYCIFDADMYLQIKERRELEQSLGTALQRGELELWYQPQFNLITNSYRGFEALLRWNRGDLGMVFPDTFIPVAEETGLMVPIGEWVLRSACEFALDLNLRYGQRLMVSVNVSAIQLLNEAYVPSVTNILKETGIDPELVELEITESILISSLSIATRKLQELRTLGISVALDDFGTGYSSLNYLKDLPIDLLKIDKTFVDDVCENERNIVGDIIKIGHSMGLQVIAEGVEQLLQQEYLKLHDCDHIQGYYYSKPLPGKDVPAKLCL